MAPAEEKRLREGKLPPALLERLLAEYAQPGPDRGVIVGPSVGIDSAVIELPTSSSPSNPLRLIAKTDPVTFVAEDIGSYALHVNANDIAVTGGVPRWFLATVLLPPGTTEKGAEEVFAQLSRACREVGVALCGGHTEVTPTVNSTVVAGQMLGTVENDRLVTAAGARPGDDLILTKGVAVEGVSIIARARGRELVEEGAFTEEFIDRCRDYVTDPGISVLPEARIVLDTGRVHAMHDPTEGGLATGVWELAKASDCGIIVNRGSIKVLDEAAALFAHFGLDPLGVIASGSLLASVEAGDTDRILESLEKSGIRAARIGRVTDKAGEVMMKDGGKSRLVVPFEADEITKVLA